MLATMLLGPDAASLVKTYATWNPSDKDSAVSLSDGNMTAVSSAGWRSVRSTIGKSTGKWYWEVTCSGTPTVVAAVCNASSPLSSYVGNTDGYSYAYDGATRNAGAIESHATYTNGDVIGIALDMDNKTVSFYKNNVLQKTYTGLVGTMYAACSPYVSTTVNFGFSAFTYNPPTGHNRGLYD